jgi:hypothetical protein
LGKVLPALVVPKETLPASASILEGKHEHTNTYVWIETFSFLREGFGPPVRTTVNQPESRLIVTQVCLRSSTWFSIVLITIEHVYQILNTGLINVNILLSLSWGSGKLFLLSNF